MEFLIILILAIVIVGVTKSKLRNNTISSGSQSNQPCNTSYNCADRNIQYTDSSKWYSCANCGHEEKAYSKPMTCPNCRKWGTFM